MAPRSVPFVPGEINAEFCRIGLDIRESAFLE